MLVLSAPGIINGAKRFSDSFNPSDKDANITLSNSNRTAACNSGSNTIYFKARSKKSYPATANLKVYFEIASSALGNSNFGLADSIAPLSGASAYLGSASESGHSCGLGWSAAGSSWIWFRSGLSDAVSLGGTFAFTRMRFAAWCINDPPNRWYCWIAKDAGAWQGIAGGGDPTSAANPLPSLMNAPIYLCFSPFGSNNDNVTICTTASQCTYVPPAGYSYWD